ncbi:MAG: hypothetical protein EPO24_00570 [Bacteroidetes bacterium]|nr:MAG: hypothetical protein EPO24_00570 [Bacteroidota bacterium]
MKQQDIVYDDDLMKQDDERGPGWFLKIAYIVIALFCIYYFFEYKDWKSSYETQQEQLRQQIGK